MKQKVLPWVKAFFSSLCVWAGISMSRAQEQWEQLLTLLWGMRNRENEMGCCKLSCWGVCAETKTEPWGDISGIADILWPWIWPERPRGWAGSQSYIVQWGGTKEKWDHFSAFQCGWLKHICDTTRCPDGYYGTSGQGAVRFQGAAGGMDSFFLSALIFSKWPF